LRLPAFPIVPTGRALALLVLLTPVALVVAATAPSAWIVAPAAALTVLVLVLLDGWMAGSLHRLDIHVPHDAEVGQPAAVQVTAELARDSDAARPEAALGFDARLGLHGAVDFTLAGYGRTTIRKEGSGLVQLRSQCSQGGSPFAVEAEARRTGTC
jgi:uncharacterized protein (DUF58 family)